MKALLIAGGFGTRMRPLTYTRPKHLLPIANKPHIEHVFDKLRRHGVDGCVLLTSYLAEAFTPCVRAAEERGLSLEIAHEPTPMGTAGALKNAARFLDDTAFLALNGDILTDADLEALVAFHRERGAEGTVLLTPVDDPTQFGVVPTDVDGRVEAFIEKPPAGEAPTNMINAGVYVLEPSVLDRIPADRESSAERELFPELVRDGTMFARPTDAYWLDLGTPDKYLKANMDALNGAFVADEISLRSEGTNVIGGGSEIAPTASVSMSCVGAGTVISDGSRVTGSVLLPDCVVGERAIVSGSILGEGVHIEAGARVEGATLGDGEKVEVD